LKLIPSLGSDNHSGAHPEILEALIQANRGHAPSYGNDPWTEALQLKFRDLMGPNCEAHLVFNGTAANILCLDSLVESHQAVICSDIAHLHMDECGAPEKNIGCKLLPLPSTNGKISPGDIRRHVIRLGDQHYAQVRAVSITQPTEYGTLYSLPELKEIRQICSQHNLLLHIDGARFIYTTTGLNCDFRTITQDLGVDAISFGGTKNGLVFGEACLLFNEKGKHRFKYRRKQMMQLPSKQRLIAAQFLRLLTDNLWQDIAQHGHSQALYLRKRLGEIPEIHITQPTQANSVFAEIPKPWVKKLKDHTFFYVWDESTFECRLMISFDVTKEMIDAFIDQIKTLRGSA